MELLKTYRKEYNTKRLALGSYWNDTGFVFVQENGKPMHPDTLTDYCSKFRNKYNAIIEEENSKKSHKETLRLLPHINPHAFRHTQASILILSGLDCTTVSKRLGHAKTSTTTDIYGHLLQKADAKASNILTNLFYKEHNKKISK